MSEKRPSVHARTQFAIRSDGSSVPVDRAWEEAFPVTVDGDEDAQTRMHGETGILLLARDDTIVTVKRAAHEQWYSARVSRCSDCEEPYDPMQKGLTCPYCGYENDPLTDDTGWL